jgi:hypothetical protein
LKQLPLANADTNTTFADHFNLRSSVKTDRGNAMITRTTTRTEDTVMPFSKTHQVIRAAKEFVADALADEKPINIGLEEIEYDPDQQLWKVTIGFSRPWNTERDALTALGGERALRRTYKVLDIKDVGLDVLSMRNRPSD